MSSDIVRASLEESQAALKALLSNDASLKAVAEAGDRLVASFKNGGRVFSCGNGGSMCDAMHFAEELSGRYRLDRRGLPAVSISEPSHIEAASATITVTTSSSRAISRRTPKRATCFWPSAPAARARTL